MRAQKFRVDYPTQILCHEMFLFQEDFTVDPIGALDRIKEESKSKRFGTSTPYSSSKPVGERRHQAEQEEPTRLSGFDFGASR